MSFSICWPTSQGVKCKFIPVLKPRWPFPWLAADPWVLVEKPWDLSFLERLRVAAAILLLRPRDPWREVGVALPDAARRDLALLSAIDGLAGRLDAGARDVLQATLPGAAGRVPLPAGAEVRWEAER